MFDTEANNWKGRCAAGAGGGGWSCQGLGACFAGKY